MAKPYTFLLNSIMVPIYAATDLSFTYGKVGGFARLRTVLGAGISQYNWSKRQISISGSGSIPFPLSEIDIAAQHTLKCGSPLDVGSVSHIITVPATRRSDVAVEAYAVMDDKSELVATVPGSPTGNVYTLTTVAGAIAYILRYWPQYTVFCSPPQQNGNHRSKDYGWSMDCEEV